MGSQQDKSYEFIAQGKEKEKNSFTVSWQERKNSVETSSVQPLLRKLQKDNRAQNSVTCNHNQQSGQIENSQERNLEAKFLQYLSTLARSVQQVLLMT